MSSDDEVVKKGILEYVGKLLEYKIEHFYDCGLEPFKKYNFISSEAMKIVNNANRKFRDHLPSMYTLHYYFVEQIFGTTKSEDLPEDLPQLVITW